MVFVSILYLGGFAVVLGLAIAYISQKYSAKRDEKVSKILAVLPNTDCGACGFKTCVNYAESILYSNNSIIDCIFSSEKASEEIAEILGYVSKERTEKHVAGIHCKGGLKEAKDRSVYAGVNDCRAAMLITTSNKKCEWSCFGMGSCLEVCDQNAIIINTNNVAEIDPEKCNACKKCIVACPKKIIRLRPYTAKIFIACSNHERGSNVKDYCDVGCTACTICEKVTPNNAIEIKDNLPELDYNAEENFIAAVHRCPQNCFTDLAPKRPKVNIDKKCNGCGECIKICPAKGAIEGRAGEKHNVIFEKCIGCGRCLYICPVRAIHILGALGYKRQ